MDAVTGDTRPGETRTGDPRPGDARPAETRPGAPVSDARAPDHAIPGAPGKAAPDTTRPVSAPVEPATRGEATTTPPAAAKKPRRRVWRRLLTLLGLLLTAAAGAAIWYWPVTPPEQKAARSREANVTIPVVAAPVAKRDMPVWLDGLGTVQAFQSVTVKSMVDGPLAAVEFREGQDIRAGEVMARIDPRIYQAALDSAMAKKSLDEATLANARLDLARYQKLVATNYATQQQADTAKATVAQLEAQVRQDQAQIDTAKTQLSYTTVTAPLSGKVGMRQVDAGNIVHASDAGGLAVITQLQPISVVFTLPQQNLAAVAAAQTQGKAEVVAYAQGNTPGSAPGADQGGVGPGGVGPGNTRALDTGTLTVLDNQIDQTTGTIRMKATFPNQSGTLWPGGFVGVRLRVDTMRGALVVPPSAVQRGPRQSFVYVVKDDSTVVRQTVTIGYEDSQGSVVTAGLADGDKVVVDGASRLSDGAKVSVVTPGADTASRGGDRPRAPGAGRRDRGGPGG